MADINLFTVMMDRAFLESMAVVAKPAPFQKFTYIKDSKARIENYAWMTPAPGVSEYQGHRRGATIDQIKYTVENKEYDGMISVPLRDFQDDQIDGYLMRMKDLTLKAKEPFESRLVLAALAAGKTTTCFDGTNYFATSHALGGYPAAPNGFTGGGNYLSFTSTNSADGIVHRFAILITPDEYAIKPMILQKRKPPKFMTDAGTPQSEKAKNADYWIDLEMGVGYGYPWDACLCEITNTPSLIDLFTCVDAVRQQFRGMTLPTSLPTDPLEYVHEQTQFNAESATIVCSRGIEQLLNHLLYEDRIGVNVAGSTGGITSNIYYNRFGLVVSNYLN